tara:strand:+ start:1747 stop:1920 length:174 start_codon:yes stop_codon:yes gene_type:complete
MKKNKIQKLRNELKQLNKSKNIKTKKINKEIINIPYIKKEKVIYKEEENMNYILDKL